MKYHRFRFCKLYTLSAWTASVPPIVYKTRLSFFATKDFFLSCLAVAELAYGSSFVLDFQRDLLLAYFDMEECTTGGHLVPNRLGAGFGYVHPRTATSPAPTWRKDFVMKTSDPGWHPFRLSVPVVPPPLSSTAPRSPPMPGFPSPPQTPSLPPRTVLPVPPPAHPPPPSPPSPPPSPPSPPPWPHAPSPPPQSPARSPPPARGPPPPFPPPRVPYTSPPPLAPWTPEPPAPRPARRCIAFDGVDDVLALTQLTGARSVSLWVRWDPPETQPFPSSVRYLVDTDLGGWSSRYALHCPLFLSFEPKPTNPNCALALAYGKDLMSLARCREWGVCCMPSRRVCCEYTREAPYCCTTCRSPCG